MEVSPVFFHTVGLRPNYRVTVRNAVDGWDRDVYTHTYRDGAWVFEFERDQYPAQLEMKLFLDGALCMSGANPQLLTTRDHPP